MRNYIRGIAEGEGWTDATTVDMLSSVLETLVRDKVIADAQLREMISEHAAVDDEPPEVDDVVIMEGTESMIIVREVPDHQPDSANGVFTIVDQYGESHKVERDDQEESWLVLVPAI